MAINAAEMTPEQKLQFLEDQILQIRAGQLEWMLCPYCGGENRPSNEFLCCVLFVEATNAVVDRMEKRDALDFMAEVSDRQLNTATKKYAN